MNLYSQNGCLKGDFFYTIPLCGDYIVAIDIELDRIYIHELPNQVQDIYALIEDKENGLLCLSRDGTVFLYDIKHNSFEKSKSIKSQEGCFFSCMVTDNTLYRFPGNSSCISVVELQNMNNINVELGIKSVRKPLFGKSCIAYKNNIILNTIYPNDIGGYLAIFEQESERIKIAIKGITERGFTDLGVLGNSVIGMTADGTVFDIDIEKEAIINFSAESFIYDKGYRNMVIREEYIYCFSKDTGEIIVHSRTENKNRIIKTSYEGFYGIFFIRESRYITIANAGSVVLFELIDGDIKITKNYNCVGERNFERDYSNRLVIGERDGDLARFIKRVEEQE